MNGLQWLMVKECIPKCHTTIAYQLTGAEIFTFIFRCIIYVLSSHYLGVGDADSALYEAILFRGL